ncbi:MAG: hypothetical protein EXR70_00955 [Deltaproteobacteria bacterium]|nr:hypothetical protein [Deltaproteobacteria bacterium]
MLDTSDAGGGCAEPGGKPLRVKLLGEELVLFRAKNGQLGLIGAICPHRLAPLFYGRVEDDGLRCIYHGWKFAPGGKCLEMPNVPAELGFTDRIHHPGYPCVERGGIIWTYMGRAQELPALPDLEFLRVDDDDRQYRLIFSGVQLSSSARRRHRSDPRHVAALALRSGGRSVDRRQPARAA